MVTPSNISYVVFPKHRPLLQERSLNSALKTLQQFVKHAEGLRLSTKGILELKKVYPKLKGKMFPGGQDVIFAWSIPLKKVNLLLKPYYNKDLITLLLHHLSVEEFGHTSKFSGKDSIAQIKLPPVIGIAQIQDESLKSTYPILITTESKGKLVMGNAKIIGLISKVARSLAKGGFIVDVYPANWRYKTNRNRVLLEYIDLILSNNLKDIDDRIAAIIYQLTKKKLRPQDLPVITINGIGPKLAKQLDNLLEIKTIIQFLRVSDQDLAIIPQLSLERAKKLQSIAQQMIVSS